jgi:protein-ribulosamine 3-kinase
MPNVIMRPSIMLKAIQKYSTCLSIMKLDPAVAKLLNLNPENATVSSAGGGGCSSASTSKITAKLSDGTERCYFMKTGEEEDAEVMFKGP